MTDQPESGPQSAHPTVDGASVQPEATPGYAYAQQPYAAYGQPDPAQQPYAGYPQQPYGQAYGQPYGYAPPVPDPGQTLNILSLVGAFVLPIAGFVLGLIGRKKSREAGFPGTMGTVGLWVSVGIFVVQLVAVVLIFVQILFTALFIGTAVSTFDEYGPTPTYGYESEFSQP